VNEDILKYALKLLAGRDYSVGKLREKLQARFEEVPDEVIEHLMARRFLNDRRYAENYVTKRRTKGPVLLREELMARGIPSVLANEVLATTDWPSLHDALNAKMIDWNLRAPLQSRDAIRLFRALARLGYEEDAIREEIDQLREC